MAKSKVAGILCIVSGAWSILSAAMMLVMSFILPEMMVGLPGGPPAGFFDAFVTFYIIYGGLDIILGALAILGGIYAMQRKSWAWALAGAIASIIGFFPTGIAAIIVLMQAQSEFSSSRSG